MSRGGRDFISISSKSVQHQVCVVEDIGPTMVLGYDFLVRNDVTCHYGQRVMLLGQVKVKLEEER